MQRVAVVGAGWAGLAAAVQATQLGHQVTVYEATRQVGGRARTVVHAGKPAPHGPLDNGQHILIGACTTCLQLMQTVGSQPNDLFLRMPLTLLDIHGNGIRLRGKSSSLGMALAILQTRHWSLRQRVQLLRVTHRWRRQKFQCAPRLSVAALCHDLPKRVVQELIEPLCVAALNTPMSQASGTVFLHILQEALFGEPGATDLLLPRTPLGALFPEPALAWLRAHGAQVRLGERVDALQHRTDGWALGNAWFDHVIWATSSVHAAQTMAQIANQQRGDFAPHIRNWANGAATLPQRAITTVYATCPGQDVECWPAPMLALHATADTPAQFVFNRSVLSGTDEPRPLLAFVISDSSVDKTALESAVTKQAQTQLNTVIEIVQTITEKRATFSCIPALQRPPMLIANRLLACGDYVAGPYPATLEGAVRSGVAAALQIDKR